jgi:hypothetical protein
MQRKNGKLIIEKGVHEKTGFLSGHKLSAKIKHRQLAHWQYWQ